MEPLIAVVAKPQISPGETEIVGSLAYQPSDFDAVISAMAEGAYGYGGWVEERPLGDVLEAVTDFGQGRAIELWLEVGD